MLYVQLVRLLTLDPSQSGGEGGDTDNGHSSRHSDLTERVKDTDGGHVSNDSDGADYPDVGCNGGREADPSSSSSSSSSFSSSSS